MTMPGIEEREDGRRAGQGRSSATGRLESAKGKGEVRRVEPHLRFGDPVCRSFEP